MKPVRWGILGLGGHFVKRILLPMKKSESVELYGVASRNEDKARRFSEAFGVPNSFGSYERLLSDRSIEAVYIALPNHLHTDWIKKSADAGKHILCEKPLALNAQEARGAVDYARSKGVLLMEGFMYRFHPRWVRAKELVDTMHIGKVKAVQTFFCYNNPDPANIRNIRKAGGGAIYDIGCYAVSAARHIFGREPQKALSLIHRDPNLEIDSLTSGVMDFEQGHAAFTVGTQIFPYQKVDIHGSSGRMEIQVPFNTFVDVPAKLTVTNKIGEREILFDPQDQYGLEFAGFSKTVREGGEVPTPPEDAVRNLAVMDALFRSERSGKWEPVAA